MTLWRYRNALSIYAASIAYAMPRISQLADFIVYGSEKQVKPSRWYIVTHNFTDQLVVGMPDSWHTLVSSRCLCWWWWWSVRVRDCRREEYVKLQQSTWVVCDCGWAFKESHLVCVTNSDFFHLFVQWAPLSPPPSSPCTFCAPIQCRRKKKKKKRSKLFSVRVRFSVNVLPLASASVSVRVLRVTARHNKCRCCGRRHRWFDGRRRRV